MLRSRERKLSELGIRLLLVRNHRRQLCFQVCDDLKVAGGWRVGRRGRWGAVCVRRERGRGRRYFGDFQRGEIVAGAAVLSARLVLIAHPVHFQDGV